MEAVIAKLLAVESSYPLLGEIEQVKRIKLSSKNPLNDSLNKHFLGVHDCKT